MDLNESLRHELIDVHAHAMILLVENETRLALALCEARSKADLRDIIDSSLDLNVVWKSIQEKRPFLAATLAVLGELRVSHENPRPDQFYSVLRWRKAPIAKRIFMLITARRVVAMNEQEWSVQLHIVRLPSMWLHAISSPAEYACMTASNTSMLMHSITTYAMNSRFPAIHMMVIPAPLPRMREIFTRAAHEYDFQIEMGDDATNIYVDTTTQPNYVQLWRRWITLEACSRPTRDIYLQLREPLVSCTWKRWIACAPPLADVWDAAWSAARTDE